MVEGVFARAFRSSLRPIELGRRLVREIDDQRSVDVKGRTIVPNAFTFHLSQADHANFADIHEALVSELCDAAREYARDEGYTFLGPVSVEILVDPGLKAGRFGIASHMAEGKGGAAGAGALVLASGSRIVLGDRPVVIGRLSECEVMVSDPNVSRRHAEVRPAARGYVVADLGSTNGTRVNGAVITGLHQLADGDTISVGATSLRFEAS